MKTMGYVKDKHHDGIRERRWRWNINGCASLIVFCAIASEQRRKTQATIGLHSEKLHSLCCSKEPTVRRPSRLHLWISHTSFERNKYRHLGGGLIYYIKFRAEAPQKSCFCSFPNVTPPTICVNCLFNFCSQMRRSVVCETLVAGDSLHE